MKGRVLLAISCMKGGGAERVLARLGNEFLNREYEVEMLVTNSKREEIDRADLDERIPITVLQEKVKKDKGAIKVFYGIVGIYARCFCKLFEHFRKLVPAHFAHASFVWQYHKEISEVRRLLKEDSSLTVIAFLPPTIPIVLLAARGLPNKVIISERGNTARQMRHRYGRPFVKKYYKRADKIVFQSDSAKEQYPPQLWDRSAVIYNPLKKGLLDAFVGTREKRIVTFCRISLEKNLSMLIDAFAWLHQDFPGYELNIYGSPQNATDEKVYEQLVAQITRLQLEHCVKLLPFSNNIHEEIWRSAIYVNTSNYEGMCNAMLEAMALGIPSVCTDCPAGGARAIIQSGVNGMLIPVGDEQQLYDTMRKIVEDSSLAERLSQNGQKLRENLSMGKIADQWEKLLK